MGRTFLPIQLGKSGIEQIIELELTGEEKAQLAKSAEVVQGLVQVMKQGG